MSGTIRTPIVDKNGKQTTVHKRADSATGTNRAVGLRTPPASSAKVVPGLYSGVPSMAEAWNPEAYIDRSYPEFSTIVEPVNRAETVKALSDASGRKSKGEVRWVELNYRNTDTSKVREGAGMSKYSLPMRDRSDTFNIVPPKDGTPVIIRNGSGFSQLNIESGNAVIVLSSSSGNPLHISGDANVVVILGEGAKCSLDVSGDATVQIVPQSGSRGSVSPKENAQVEIMDYVASEDQHSFRDLSIPIDYEAVAKAKEENRVSEESALQEWMDGKKK